MAGKKNGSEKAKDPTTNKEYLAQILEKLGEIATIMNAQTETLKELKQNMAKRSPGENGYQNEPSYDTGYAGEGYEEDPGETGDYEEPQGTGAYEEPGNEGETGEEGEIPGSTNLEDYTGEEEYEEDYQTPPADHGWRPPHWSYKRKDQRSAARSETDSHRSWGSLEEIFAPEDEETQGTRAYEETGDPVEYEAAPEKEERYRPKTPRCPLCGMITQYSEEEDDYYCWMCEKYLNEAR